MTSLAQSLNIDNADEELLKALAAFQLRKSEKKNSVVNVDENTENVSGNLPIRSECVVNKPLLQEKTSLTLVRKSPSKVGKEPSKLEKRPSKEGKTCALSASSIGEIDDISSSIRNLARRDLPPSTNDLRPSDVEAQWTEVIEDFIEEVANSNRTRRTYRGELRKFKSFLHSNHFNEQSSITQNGGRKTVLPKDLKKEHYQRYATYVSNKGLATNTTRSYLIPIKSFGTFLMGKYDMNYNAASVIKLDRSERTKDEIIPDEQMESILADTSGKKQEFVALLYFGGLRLFEVCKIQYKDIVLETKHNEFAASIPKRQAFRRKNQPPKETTELTVTTLGKGNKTRTVVIGTRGRYYLEHLARYERKQDYVFPGQDTRCPISKRTGQNWIQKICKGRMTDEFSQRSKITPHMFRHTAASDAFRNGAGISEVSQFLGHASKNTTEIYLHANKQKPAGSFL